MATIMTLGSFAEDVGRRVPEDALAWTTALQYAMGTYGGERTFSIVKGQDL